MFKRCLFNILALLTCLTLLGQYFAPIIVKAAGLTNISDTLSDNHVSPTTSNHTLAFTTATTADLKQIDFQFSTTSGGTTKPANLDLSSTTLGALTNLGTDWNLDTNSASSGLLKLTRDATTNIPASTAASVILQNITNSSLGDCQVASGTLTDTCHLKITTYSDNGVTAIDNGSTTYTVMEDPSMNFEVKSVAADTTHNGITTSLDSTANGLPFGNLKPNEVKYIAHELSISSNSPHGYKVYAYLEENIKGQNISSTISPFGATNATWDNPVAWEDPTGTEPNSNTGWFAANTTDSRVTGWENASQKFGPISPVPHLVATSDGPDESGSTIYVTYAFGVNSLQPSDTYSGKIIYDVQTTF